MGLFLFDKTLCGAIMNKFISKRYNTMVIKLTNKSIYTYFKETQL